MYNPTYNQNTKASRKSRVQQKTILASQTLLFLTFVRVLAEICVDIATTQRSTDGATLHGVNVEKLVLTDMRGVEVCFWLPLVWNETYRSVLSTGDQYFTQENIKLFFFILVENRQNRVGRSTRNIISSNAALIQFTI